MTTTKELLLQSFTKSREVIQKERKALNAYVAGNVGKIPPESAVFAIRGTGVYDEIDKARQMTT